METTYSDVERNIKDLQNPDRHFPWRVSLAVAAILIVAFMMVSGIFVYANKERAPSISEIEPPVETKIGLSPESLSESEYIDQYYSASEK